MLIPRNNGYSTINGLPISTKVCIVYNPLNLEILDVAETHNKAEEISHQLYHSQNLNALTEMVEYHDDKIKPFDLIGLSLDNFECYH